MVGERGQCYFDHPSQTFWQDFEHEYAGEVLFGQLRGKRRLV